MNTRKFIFANFRNLGKANKNTLFLNAGLGTMEGDLILIIGENNAGKTNALAALNAFGLKTIKESDKPNFLYYNEAHTPSISLVYNHQPSTNLDKNQAKTLNSNTQSSKYSIELTYTENKNGEASQEIDKQATIKALQAKFQAIKELIARDKDGDYIDDERWAKFNELEKELKQFHIDEIGKSYIPIAKFKEFYEDLQDFCFGEIELKKSDSRGLYNHNQANIHSLDEKFKEFEARFLSEKNQSKFTELKNEWESLKEKWKWSFGDTSDAKFTMMQKFYASLQELLFPKDEFEKQILRYESSKCTVKRTIDKDFETRFGIKANPKIFFYKPTRLKDSDLSTTPNELENSVFFKSLCAALQDDKWQLLIKHYKEKKSAQRGQLEEKINEHIKMSISKHFNKLYNKDETYSFNLRLEENKLEFLLYKNGEALKLSEQSSAFEWFFNFFFNFLHAQTLNKGDLVLIDELETHFSVPAQRELRTFLKAYAKRNGITFIATTHSPFLADIEHLDELRIIKQQDDGGADIINDFSLFSKDKTRVDALKDIKKAFGVQGLVSKRVIFVEGITDYNYLIKFKQLYQQEKKVKLNLAFLPVGGLGDPENSNDEKAKHLIKELPKLIDRHAILLVDNDDKGKAFQKQAEKCKDLTVVRIDEAFEDSQAKSTIEEIETLFSQADRERHKEILQAKSKPNESGSVASRVFKNGDSNDFKLEEQTKENFFTLLEYLNKFEICL